MVASSIDARCFVLSLFWVEKPLSQETDAPGAVVRIDDIVLKSGKAFQSMLSIEVLQELQFRCLD